MDSPYALFGGGADDPAVTDVVYTYSGAACTGTGCNFTFSFQSIFSQTENDSYHWSHPQLNGQGQSVGNSGDAQFLGPKTDHGVPEPGTSGMLGAGLVGLGLPGARVGRKV